MKRRTFLQITSLDVFSRNKDMTRDFVFSTAIFLISIVYFLPSINLFFYADDPVWIHNGRLLIEEGILSSGPFYNRLVPTFGFAVQYSLFGSNYTLYHAFNVFLFAVGAVFFYRFVRCFYRRQLMCFVITLLYVLNPFNFERVNWISMQSYSWLLIFLFATLAIFLRYLEHRRRRDYLLFYCAFAATLWSHEVGIIAPILLLFLYGEHCSESKRPLHMGNFLKIFSPIFITALFYCWNVYKLVYLATPEKVLHALDFRGILPLVKGVVSFVVFKLNYIFYLMPLGLLRPPILIVKITTVTLVGILLLFGPKRVKFAVLWIILAVVPFYMAPPHRLPCTTKYMACLAGGHIAASAVGVMLLFAYCMNAFMDFVPRIRKQRIKSRILLVALCMLVIEGIYFVHLPDAFSLVSIRNSWRYRHYDMFVRTIYGKIAEGTNIYFVDNSEFIQFTGKAEFHKVTKCKGSGLRFAYVPFMYHLKVSNGIEQINGYAMSPQDVTNIDLDTDAVIIDVLKSGS